MNVKDEKIKDAVAKVKRYAAGLESDDAKDIEDAAYWIAGTLFSLENEFGKLDEKLEAMVNLAADLELPRAHVIDYEIKLKDLIAKIKNSPA